MAMEEAEADVSLTESANSIVYSSFEQALAVAGSFGRYQLRFVLCVQLTVLLWCGNFAFMSYAIHKPIIECHLNDSTSLVLNKTNEEDFCGAFEGGECANMTWSGPFGTIIEEWELICSKDWIPEAINSCQMAGTVLAMVFSGLCADFLGRRSVFLATFVALFGSILASTASTGPASFAALRFLMGGMLSASSITNFVWGMELTDQGHNVIVNCSQLWHFAYIITAGIAWLFDDWRTYSWVVAGLCSPLLVLYAGFGESPRWLIQKGRPDKAADQLNKIAALNRPVDQQLRFSSASLASIPVEDEEGGGTSLARVLLLFSTRKLAAFTVTMMSLYMASAAAAMAFIFEISELPGHPSLKFLVYGLARMWIPFAIYGLDKKCPRFGRREMLLWPMGLVVGSFGSVALLGAFSDHPSITLVGMFLGATVVNANWVALGQFTIELYPTSLRNTAVAYVSLFDPLIGVLMPQLVYLQKWWQSLPAVFVTFACGGALALGYLLLPETKGRPLPETTADLDTLQFHYRRVGVGRRISSGRCCGEEEALMDDVEQDDVVFDISDSFAHN